MVVEKRAVADLKKGLKKFREDASKQGWEEDEIEAKISEVYENFPWYKYNPSKSSWKSKFFNFLLYSFIIYLAVGAVLEKNRRWKKKVDDLIFDSQIQYHSQRLIRIITLPLFNIYDLSKIHEDDCLIKNPFRVEDEPDCTFCEGIESMPTLSIQNADAADMIAESEPIILKDVPGYFDHSVQFIDFQQMFKENQKELDDAVCKITEYETSKMSEFFDKMDEAKMVEQNVSVEWSNCHTYGTRFYRQLFSRPSFVSKESEIHFEKRVFMLQKDHNTSIQARFDGKSIYIYQLQGESTIELLVTPSCHFNCTTEPITATIKTGSIAIFPNNDWKVSLKAMADGLNIAFLSSFT